MTKIATLMAVYHGDNPRDFRAAIDSILAQNLEESVVSRIYLAIDGPVPDPLNREIQEVERHLFKIVRQNENKGLANALNSLISLLNDEQFIFRMDADDISMATRYQSQLHYLNQNPEIDILGTDMFEFDPKHGTRRVTKFSRSPDEARNRLCWRVPVAHPTVCFRRHVFDCINGYPNVPHNEDIALWFLCAQQGYSFGNVPEPLYQFKVDEKFWNRRSIQKAFWEWRCYTLGGLELDGLSWKIFLPSLRLALRLSPKWLQRRAYESRIRRPIGK